MTRLNGKVAIVTGAGSGMGLATSRKLHAEGAMLVLTDISGAEQKTAAELGDRVVAITANVADPTAVQKIMNLAISEFGGIDIVCNIAGITLPATSFIDTPDDDFDKTIDVNLRAVYLMMKASLPHLVARGAGSIVNIASTAAVIGTPGLAVYSASKSGVMGLTRTAALEYAPQGVRVNAVLPGPIKTPMMDEHLAKNPDNANQLIEMVPMRRVGYPEDIADAISFLASDESSFINGIALPVDGGMTAA